MIVRNFEYLLALHREGHFGNAAKSCNLSQPTLSAGIKQLEEDMGVEIVRHGRRYDGLTSEGMRVLSWAQQMYDDCKGLERELSALRRGIEGQFRLGILPGTAGVAPTLSIALAEKTPLLQQSVLVSGASSLLQAIRENNLDIALMHLEDIPGEDFDTHLLYRERIFLFHAARTQQPRSTTWDHVLNRQLCVLNSAVPEPIQDRLMQCTAQTIRTDSIDVLSAHVATGKYSAVLPQSLAGQLAHIPNLHAIAINGPMSHSNVGFVAGKNAFEAPSSRALLEMVHTPELAATLQSVISIHRRFQPKADSSQSPLK
ncbi:LysR family transcriptional regulator [Serratia marcescens]|uniref:LysR family transcriptional regulator n=1 Tax=Serratia marcescens TaxID=615 RepID=UPI000EFDF6F2|nr:LysR family transcriptional regulator [Serratia marcescens]RMW79276.1 LysR family transcriptional regulator [Serratia marcescens]